MARFFLGAEARVGDGFFLVGDDARHISRSLRMRPGEGISVVCEGRDFLCTIEKITDSTIVAKILSEADSNEPSLFVRLFQALPKQDKLESIIQKSVELGVSEIIPVLTKRCISRPEPEQFTKKSQRLMKISEAAAKQSGRGIIPRISEIISLEECLGELGKCDISLICYEKEGGRSLREIDFSAARSVGILIGPEGGFDPEEAASAVQAGAVPIWLGKRILRCETAPIAAISVVMALSGNM